AAGRLPVDERRAPRDGPLRRTRRALAGGAEAREGARGRGPPTRSGGRARLVPPGADTAGAVAVPRERARRRRRGHGARPRRPRPHPRDRGGHEAGTPVVVTTQTLQ